MASTQEKAQCVLWVHESRFPVTVHRQFRREYGRDSPDVKSIEGWYDKFKETGSVGNKRRSGRLGVSDSAYSFPTQSVEIDASCLQRNWHNSEHHSEDFTQVAAFPCIQGRNPASFDARG